MDSCDSAGRSMICGGSKKIYDMAERGFHFSYADFGVSTLIFLNISFSPPWMDSCTVRTQIQCVKITYSE